MRLQAAVWAQVVARPTYNALDRSTSPAGMTTSSRRRSMVESFRLSGSQ